MGKKTAANLIEATKESANPDLQPIWDAIVGWQVLLSVPAISSQSTLAPRFSTEPSCLSALRHTDLSTWHIKIWVENQIPERDLGMMGRIRARGLSLWVAVVLLGVAALHSTFNSPRVADASVATVALPASQKAPQRSATALTVLGNRAYTVHYNEELRNPACVLYQLRQVDKLSSPPSRPHIPFQTDIRTRGKVDSRNFSRSGFDHGHMAPSHAIGTFHGPEAQAETFLLSNICPQNHKTNEGVWNSIERMETDDFAKRFGSVTVICGPVFDSNPPRLPSGIAVPKGFFKIIQRPDQEIICFLVPQETASPKPESYLVSLNNINAATGLNLLPELPAERKARVRPKIW